MTARETLARLPRYLWAAPCSMAGLCIALVAVLLGAKAQVKNGTLQVAGGRLGTGITRLPTRLTIQAFTHGHIIYAVSESAMESYRRHELVHVRQDERWGLLFPFLYLGSSFIQRWKGRDPYFANWFEQEANKADEPTPDGHD